MCISSILHWLKGISQHRRSSNYLNYLHSKSCMQSCKFDIDFTKHQSNSHPRRKYRNSTAFESLACKYCTHLMRRHSRMSSLHGTARRSHLNKNIHRRMFCISFYYCRCMSCTGRHTTSRYLLNYRRSIDLDMPLDKQS